MRSAAAGLHSRALGTAGRATVRYTRTRRRLEQTAAGHLHRRVAEIDLVRQAMILAALALMLLIPLLISISALLPLGSADGTASVLAHRSGLSAEATRDLQQLFPSRDTVRGSTTWLGVLITLVSAFSWPAALQKGYQLAWGLPPLDLRGMWRPLVWLVSLVAVVVGANATSELASGVGGAVLLALLGSPVIVGWAWWTQHLLLGGRIGWRPLLPGAIAIGIGVLGLRLFAALFLSASITTNYRQYGPLGVVFMLLSWLIGFSVVMLGGAVVGATLHEHPLRRGRSRPPTRATGPVQRVDGGQRS